MATAPEIKSIRAQIRKQTDKALMLEYENKIFWLPLSQIENWEDTPDGFTKVTIPLWLAKEKGIA